MAPKKSKDSLNDAAGVTEEQQAALALSQRLQSVAKSQGVRETSFVRDGPLIPPVSKVWCDPVNLLYRC